MSVLLGACGGSSPAPTIDGEARRGAVEVAEVAQVTGGLCSFRSDDCKADDDPAVGEAAPTFRSVDPSGAPVGPLEDGAVTIVFVAHWCEFCQADLPALLDAAESLPIVLVSTAQDPSAGNWPPSRWLGEAGWDGLLVVDDVEVSIASAFGVSALPYYVVLDDAGTVVRRASGSKTAAEIIDLATT